jgi:ech hydrogenase subunit B
MEALLLALVGIILAPVAGGLISGVDRRVTARFQSRMGPPIMQPFYDAAKLWAKDIMVSNIWAPLCAWVYFVAAVASVALFFAGQNLLLIFFVQAVGAVFLVIGAMSVPSPYSQVGAQRELLQILTYEPLVLLVMVAMGLEAGSFQVADIYAHETPLLATLPLMIVVLSYALTIKLRKSPFDVSASHHAHQEIVRGVYTEFSGRHMALIEVAHWYEVVLFLGLFGLFWSTSVVGMLIIILGAYFIEIVIDNAAPRMSWKFMIAVGWVVGLSLSAVNLLWIYLR